VSESWYSALLRFVTLIDDDEGSSLERSVVLFRAREFPDARERALAIGRSRETSYVGGTGRDVLVRFQGVETLDILGAEIADGREVYSESVDLSPAESFTFSTEFDPNNVETTSSRV
jgi:hypothetical protein